ncbi:conjugal transfer protein TraD [Pseudomonas sp. NW5]|uniref:conjugal transfer protein TraD n=1 Tax=Pseudomonas sp. NW5 TaxID=2934934 RepID=UPI002020093B|nr:conjugal transfer protein TraD [Pseudomonas sp. NW5]MCL7463197.1 conjugal transfer protein TraD [Pseudomonas sp. NW5]
MHDEWLTARIAYLRGLKSPSDQQRLLLLLADKPERSNDDNRKLSALVKAEKAAERAQKAKANAARIVNAEKAAERKARDRELYQAAGLLILAGLVDSKTGRPTVDRGELLGALLGLAKVPLDDQRRSEWKRAGDAMLAAKSSTPTEP